jgi:hypothetical protein
MFRSQDWMWCYRDGAYIQWGSAQSTGQGRSSSMRDGCMRDGCMHDGSMHDGQPCSSSGDEPTPSPRAAAVAKLGPALELLARSGRRPACAAAAFSFSGGRTRRQGLLGLSSSEHCSHVEEGHGRLWS